MYIYMFSMLLIFVFHPKPNQGSDLLMQSRNSEVFREGKITCSE